MISLDLINSSLGIDRSTCDLSSSLNYRLINKLIAAKVLIHKIRLFSRIGTYLVNGYRIEVHWMIIYNILILRIIFSAASF